MEEIKMITKEKLEIITWDYNKRWAHKLFNIIENGNIESVTEYYQIFLEENGFHKIKPERSDKNIYVHIQNHNVEKADPDYAKKFVLEFLIDFGSKEIRDFVAKNDILFSDQSLFSLRERIPYSVYWDCEEFLLMEGTLVVTDERIFMKHTE
jgi:hypothetical protein